MGMASSPAVEPLVVVEPLAWQLAVVPLVVEPLAVEPLAFWPQMVWRQAMAVV